MQVGSKRQVGQGADIDDQTAFPGTFSQAGRADDKPLIIKISFQ